MWEETRISFTIRFKPTYCIFSCNYISPFCFFFGWKVVPYLRLCLDRFTTKIRKFVTNYVRRLHLDKLHALQILLLLPPPLLFSYQTGNFSSNYQAGIVFLRYMFLKSPAFIAMQEKLSIFAPPTLDSRTCKKILSHARIIALLWLLLQSAR